ncbi:MAG: hypothetical protein JKX78_03765 [Alteromonadaceae bacterium]|nr:hypothetical protein [Alteromonadaceae bacterium]MBL4909070.1 hypothetical protein [Alteromonadaceae bacterium]MBL4909136.1 hypothetical protein [Alteromonadaceae bacterium]
MTIFRMNGFGNIANDSGDLLATGWAFAGGTRALAGGRFGGNGYKLNGDSQVLVEGAIGSILSNPRWGNTWWANWANIGADSNIWIIGNFTASGTMPSSTTASVVVRLKSDGALELYTTGVLRQTTATGVITTATDHHIEVRAFASDVGTADVWVDGVSVLSFAGDCRFGSASPTSLFVGGGLSTDCVIDDLVTIKDDVTQLNSHQIHELLPDGAGDNTAWTGTFADVDDPLGTPDEDTTVITSKTLGDKQDHNFGALPVSPVITTIHAVELNARVRVTQDIPRDIVQYTISGATETDEATKAVTDSYVTQGDILALDPNTAAAWTVAAVDALKVGVKVTT